MEKFLITGGCGFIGSFLAEELINQNKKVVVIDDLSTGSIKNISCILNHSNFTLFIDTILNKDILEQLIKNVDFVFHLAAVVGVKKVMEDPIQSIVTNIEGTYNVLKGCAKYKKKVLITSTSEIYGKNTNVPFSESADIVIGSTKKKRWSYACSKAIDEFLSFAFYEEYNLPIIVVRLFNTVGPRQTERYGMVIPRFVKQALSGNPITIFGNGEQTRCFIHVKDVISTLLKLIEKEESYGDVFNIGSNEEIKIKNLAFFVKEITKSDSEIKFINPEEVYNKGFEDMTRRIPDLNKLKKIINFQLSYSIKDIINDVVEYYKKQSDLLPYFY
ncbi:MAG: GDP-mannose 4,6-dehydratase [Candidatus Omnitrophica bacterium]|nr:GDP-mannose 4,6-dehydratase [Candidatus Omnitrophota bacterium]MCM8802014.1 GDP-mannose 4,6-dehydratase [Candidatus Omnitrophota bacterium]